MAIDFSQVKSLTIPEGDVKSISIGGVIVWQKNLPYELYENYYLTSHSYTYNTNYIDLGIKWNNNWKLEGKFYKPTTISQWGRLLGTGYDTSSEVYVNYNADTNGDFVINYSNTYTSQLSNVYQTNVEYNFAFGNRGNKCSCYFLTPGGSWTSFGTTWSPSNTNSTHNLRLFSNEQGDRDGIFGIGKIQINGPDDLWSEDGALMLLVPARRKSDGCLGMYDKNNDIFYPCITSGSGYFTITDVNGNVIYQDKQLTSITLSGQTTSLNRGAAFSFGGTVTAHYNDGSTANVTSSSTFSGYDMSKAGTYTVTAQYTENGVTKTATYTLTVNKAWTQIWSGTKQISWDLTNDNPPSNVKVYSNSSLPNTSDIRITFTMSNKSGSGTNGYLKTWQTSTVSNSNWGSTKPTSPLRGSSFNPTKTYYILGVGGTNDTTFIPGQQLWLEWNSSSKAFIIKGMRVGSNTPYSGTISIKVTKIERYY